MFGSLLIYYRDSTLKRGSPHEEDEDDDIGEGGSEVDHLAAGLDPLEEAKEVDQPGDAEAKEHPPGGLPKLPEARRLSQHLIVEVEL